MAATRPAFTFSFLIATAICLMAIKAEEQPKAAEAEDRQAKQMYLVPQYYPANTQFYYPDSSPYGNLYPSPYGVPSAEAFIGGGQEDGFAYRFPSLTFDENDNADMRHVVSGGHDDHSLKSWKRNSNRQATINIFPTPAQCLVANFATDGLGPCKEASQAEQGSIQIKFSAAAQTAIIGITADSQRHTRVKLTCTDITTSNVFTQSGKIAAVTDTPRTEIGYMQLVVTSTAATSKVTCNWVSYHHYTAMYP